MRRHTALLAAAAAAALALPAAAEPSLDFKVVVHADNPTRSLTRSEMSRLFLGKEPRWDDGSAVAPVDQAAGSALREAFSQAIHGRSTESIDVFWQRRIQGGEATPPPVLGSDAEVLDFVARQPGAIGYVSAGAALRPATRILDISDLAGYESQASDAGVAAGRPDETLGQHGDLRLFLTGACGPGGAGRRAVLENRDPDYAVSAEIETSTWDDGWLKSSSVSLHALEPLAEEALGCSRPAGDLERRYAIVRASSATSHALDHRPHRPARSVVQVVDAGSCGQRRAGTWRTLINRHTLYEVTVAVEVRELAGDRLSRRYRKTHRLAPGASWRLGCSADGKITRQFTVLDANYR